MAQEYKKLGDLLVDRGAITNLQLSVALAAQQTSQRRLGQILVERGFATGTEIVRCLAEQYGYEIVDIGHLHPEQEALDLIKPDEALNTGLLPIRVTDAEFQCVMHDPLNVVATDRLSVRLGKRISIKLAAADELVAAIRSSYSLDRTPNTEDEASVSIPDRYQNAEQSGSYGDWVLFNAIDTHLSRQVTIAASYADDDKSSELFELVRHCAQTEHPNISTVHDFIRGDRVQWAVLEPMEGETLDHVLRTRGPRTPAQAAEMVSALARATDAVHRKGRVLGLIAPQNILVREFDSLIVPFELPTPEYQGEKSAHEYFDPLTDIYGLGSVLYVAVTGEAPLDADAARTMGAGVPEALQTIILRCMSANREDRFVSPIQIADALESYNWQALTEMARPTEEAYSSAGRDQLLASVAGEIDTPRRGFWQRVFGRWAA